jgi:hypothetical protein
MYNPEEKCFGRPDNDLNMLKITLPRCTSECPVVDYVTDQGVKDLINGAISYIKKRFQQLSA